MFERRRRLLCATLALLLVAPPAFAEDAIPAPSAAVIDAAAGADTKPDYHAPLPGEIVVTAPFQRDRRDLLSGVSVLQGAALTQSLRPTIGETLERTPGVSSTSFGPNASRPVLRGLQGERVRVLSDGIGSIDVSNTSVDHAVAIDPLLAERVEVLRGPAALLYGSAAIGGVVNVLDKRIPRSIPDEPVHVDMIGTYGSAANERTGAASIDAPVGDKLVVHADGSYLKTSDLKIGSYVLSPEARRQALASSLTAPTGPGEDIDFAGNAALKGTLPNSAAKTWTAGVGASIITDTGNFGISYGHYDSFYGVPVRYATLPGEEQEAPRLDIVQNRFDARGEVQTGGDILKTVPRARRLCQLPSFRAGGRRLGRHRLLQQGAGGPDRTGPGGPRRVEGRERCPIFRARLQRRRRRGFPAAQHHRATGLVHAAAAGLGQAEAGGRRALRTGPPAGQALARSAAILWRQAQLRCVLGLRRRILRTGRRLADRRECVAHGARAVSRGAFRQRPARRHRGVRDRAIRT